MRRLFLKGAADDDDAVVDAFTHHNKESALKTKPKVRSFPLSIPPYPIVELLSIYTHATPSLIMLLVLQLHCQLFLGWAVRILEAGVQGPSSTSRPSSDRGWTWK
jgi:hypothetical protein